MQLSGIYYHIVKFNIIKRYNIQQCAEITEDIDEDTETDTMMHHTLGDGAGDVGATDTDATPAEIDADTEDGIE